VGWVEKHDPTAWLGYSQCQTGLPAKLPVPGHCISRPHNAGRVRYRHRPHRRALCQTCYSYRHTAWLCGMPPNPRWPMKFSIWHRGYPVGFVTVPTYPLPRCKPLFQTS